MEVIGEGLGVVDRLWLWFALAAVACSCLAGCSGSRACPELDSNVSQVLQSKGKAPFRYGDSTVERLEMRGGAVIELPPALKQFGVETVVAVRETAWLGSPTTSFTGVDVTFRFLANRSGGRLWPADELTERAFAGDTEPAGDFGLYKVKVSRSNQMATAMRCAAAFN